MLEFRNNSQNDLAKMKHQPAFVIRFSIFLRYIATDKIEIG